MSLIFWKAAPAPAVAMDPWLRARERYMEDLTDEEKVLFSGASLENLFYSTSAAQKLHAASSRSRALYQKIQPLVQGLEQYGNALDVYSNVSPVIMCPLWGSIRVLLHVASEFGKYLEKLIDMLARIGDVLPVFRTYEILFPDHSRLLHVLSVVYLDIIKFCVDAKGVFGRGKKRSALGSFKTLWKPFDQHFIEVLDQFRLHKENVEREANLSHMIEAAEARALEKANRKEELRRRLLKQLSSVDPDYRQRKLCKVRYQNTGTWLTDNEEFNHWLSIKRSSCLWCYGIPGCGKTILASIVIDHLKAASIAEGFVVAYYYCDYSEPETLIAVTILGCLIKQLLEKSDISDGIAWQIDQCYKCGTGEPTTEELITILLAVMRLFPAIYVVIDGIDECERQEREDILSVTRQLVDIKECIVKVFIASREEADIKRSFAGHLQIHISEANVMLDINSYIKGAVGARVEAGELVVRNQSLVGIVVDALSHGARGMFLWVAFQLDELCEANSDGEIRDILQNLPKDLAETYTRILRKIVGSKRGSEKMTIARKIYQWICCAKRPLLMEELKEAIAFGPDDLSWDAEKVPVDSSRLLQACGNLVVFDTDDQTVRMAHYTVQQFLISAPTDALVADFHFQLAQAEIYAGEICIAYLSFSDFETQMVRASPSHPVRDLQALELAFSNHTTYLRGFNKVIWDAWNTISGTSASDKPLAIDFGRIMRRPEQPLQLLHEKYRFLNYATENWLGHTTSFSRMNTDMWHSFWNIALEKRMLFSHRAWDETLAPGDAPYLPLFTWAVEAGHAPLLRLLFEPPMGPGLRNYVRRPCKPTQSPLGVALRHGHAEVLDLLLAESDKSELDSRFLHFAVTSGRVEAVEALMSHFDVIAGDLSTAFEAAVASGSVAMVKAFLPYGVRPSIAALQAAIASGNEVMLNILKTALIDGVGIPAADPDRLYWAAFVQRLSANGSSVAAVDTDGQTLLHWAALHGYSGVARWLLDSGVDIEAVDGKGLTALRWAARKGQVETVRLLVSSGAIMDPKDENEPRALYDAASGGIEAVVQLLMGMGANLESRSPDRSYTAWSGLPDMRTALHGAAIGGHTATVRHLLDGGAEVEARNSYERTPLHWAAIRGHIDVARLLLDRGANPNAQDKNGRTPIYEAARENHEPLIRLLVARGADPDAEDPYGRTPLHWAAMSGYTTAVRLLLDYGADPRVEDHFGRTAWHFAVQGGYGSVVEALEQAVLEKVAGGSGGGEGAL